MNTEPLTTLKGIGEKTEKLFAKVGIYNLRSEERRVGKSVSNRV